MFNKGNCIGVVGSGTMGNGIAHVFSQANYKVVLVDLDEAILNLNFLCKDSLNRVTLFKLTIKRLLDLILEWLTL